MIEPILDTSIDYRRLFEHSPEPQVLYARKQIVGGNRAAVRLLGGTTPDEILGQPMLDYIHPDDRPAVLDRLARLPETGEGEPPLEFRLVRGDGGHVWVEAVFTPLSTDDEDAGHVALRDVSERRRAEAALQESESRFRSVLENALDAAYRRDLQADRYDYMSPVIEALIGFTPEEMEAMAAEEVLSRVHPEDRRAVEELLPKTAEVGRGTITYRFLAKDGGYRWLADHFTVQRDADGRPHFRSGIVRDVTDQKEAEAALRDSEVKFRRLVESSPVGIYILDENGRFIYVNPALSGMLGYTPDDLLKLGDVAEIVAEEDRAPLRVNLSRRLGGEAQKAPYVLQVRHAAGHTVDVEVLGAPMEYGGGPAVIGTALDVTEQRRARERIRTSEARYHALSQLLRSYGYSFSVEAAGGRTVDWVTDSMEAVFGYTPTEMKRIDWFSLIHPEDLATYRRYSDRLLEGQPGEVEFRAVTRGGTVRWIRSKGFPEWDDVQQRVVRVYGAGQDITAQKELELELVRQKERAEEMTRLKDAFLANMSHEIRTPLAAVIGAADLLHEEVHEEGRELVEFVRKGGERLMDTLASVLDLAQLEGRAVRLAPTPLDAAREVDKVLDVFRRRARERGLALHLEVAGGEPHWVRADRGAFGRVLTNLLSNALKFTGEGGVTVRIRSEDDRVVVDVEDTGVGIGEAFLPRVFDEFRQESTGHDRSYEGSGLGLAITRRLVALMDGQIAVQSKKGAGTTFTVTLPAAAGMDARPARAGAEDGAPRGLRLLVVDDEPAMRRIVAQALASAHEVHTAACGAHARRLAEDVAFDAVFLDINLSDGETGEDVLRMLRRLPGYEAVPVVALTAYALPGDPERFMATGFDGYLGKPFRTESLRRALREALEQASS